jgi:hypothetical protein
MSHGRRGQGGFVSRLKRVRGFGAVAEVVPGGFDHEAQVVLACEVYAGLNMLWCTRSDDIDRISEVTTWVLWVW